MRADPLVTHFGSADPAGSQRRSPGASPVPSVAVSSWTAKGYLVAALAGVLDITTAPAVREHLTQILRPTSCRLVIDLSAVSFADVSGLTVLVGAGRRARALGGFLRLAAPMPAVTDALSATGLDWQFDIYPTVSAAMNGQAQA